MERHRRFHIVTLADSGTSWRTRTGRNPESRRGVEGMNRLQVGCTRGIASIVVVFVLFLSMVSFAVPASAEQTWDVPVMIGGGNGGNSSHPQVTIDPTGRAIAVWQEMDGARWIVRANRYTPGLGWQSPTLIETDDADDAVDPDVAVDLNGNAIAVWTTTVTPGDYAPGRVFAKRFTPGTGWGEPTQISRNDSPAWVPRVATDGEGNAIAMWYGNGVWANRFVKGVGWGAPTQVAAELGGPAKIGFDAAGNAFAIWWAWFPIGRHVLHLVHASRYDASQGSWEPPQMIGNNTLHSVDIAVTPRGNAIAVWRAVQSYDTMMAEPQVVARRYVTGGGWQSPVTLSTFDMGCCVAASSDDDSATVVWDRSILRSNAEGGQSWETTGIHAIRFVPGSGWGGPTVISGASDGDMVVMMGDPMEGLAAGPGGHAVALWVQHDGAQATLWANRFEPDSGWGGPGPVGESIPASREELRHVVWDPGFENAPLLSSEASVDTRGNIVVVWAQRHDGRISIWANRFLSPSSADETVDALESQLQDMRDDLAATQDALDVTRDELADARDALNTAYAGLAALDAKFLILLALQTGFIALSSVLFFLYWNVRKRAARTGETREGGTPESPLSGSHSPGKARHAAGTTDPNREENRGVTWGRWPGGNGPLRLTGKERVLLHLNGFARYAEASEVPADLTAGGIARATSIDRRHFAQIVRPLVREGLLRERTARVKGILQRRKVYLVTADGRRSALEIRDRVAPVVVRVRDSSGMRDATVAEVLAASRGSLSIVDVVRQSAQSGIVDLKSEGK